MRGGNSAEDVRPHEEVPDSIFSDSRVADGFRRGEDKACRAVHVAWSPVVAGWLRRGTGGVPAVPDIWACHDCLQEVFMRAFSPVVRQSYDPARPFRPFLSAIARNVMADYWRRRHEPLRQAAENDNPDDPEALILKKEAASLLNEFESTLVPETLRLFQARYRRGLSLRQAAAQLDMSFKKMRTADARLRKSLLAFLKGKGWLPG